MLGFEVNVERKVCMTPHYIEFGESGPETSSPLLGREGNGPTLSFCWAMSLSGTFLKAYSTLFGPKRLKRCGVDQSDRFGKWVLFKS